MLEAGSGGHAGGEGAGELTNETPGVEGVEEVDVAGAAAEDAERKLALGDVGLSGLLVRVGAVAKGELLGSLAKGCLGFWCSVRNAVSRSVLLSEVV